MEDVIMANKEQVLSILADLLYDKPIGWEFAPGLEDYVGLSVDDHKPVELTPLEATQYGLGAEVKDYINDTVNRTFMGYSLQSGKKDWCPGQKYDPDVWRFYTWHYEPATDYHGKLIEPLHILAYHPETGRADLLCIEHEARDSWFIDASAFLHI